MPRSIVSHVVLPAIVACSLAHTAPAETPRAELGKRLRRFELAWQEAAAPRRAAAATPMQAAVRSFFSLQLSSAAARLDDAWLAVRTRGPADPQERAAIATAVAVTPLLADTSCEALTVTFEPLYATTATGNPRARLRLAIEDAGGTLLASREGSWAEATGSLAWNTGPLPAGDHRLVAEYGSDDTRLVVATIGLSRAERLDERLATMRDRLAALPAEASPTGRATVGTTATLLGKLAASQGQETDYPAACLLSFAEAILATEGDPREAVAAEARRADCWLTLCDGRGEAPVRLRAPVDAAEPFPVLFLLHGAGGSENMFFDAYGAGRAVTLGIDRGWLVVAPRQGFFGLPLGVGKMLDVLDDAFAIDRARIFVAGHSLGAAQTTKQVALHPRLIAAAAAIGGGGTAPTGAEARHVPWLVAAGAADFGRAAALDLAAALRVAGNRVEEHVIPDVEHMVVVQAALDDMFAFFDCVAAAADAPATVDDPVASPP